MTPPAAATAAARRAVTTPARPQRRVSGPVRPARPTAVPRPARRTAPDTLGARALAWLRTLPDHRLLHRLIGGRIWIVLLGTLLVGIVTMQLSLLRMNASIGQAVERSSQLEQSNAALRLSISQLSDTTRIVSLATQMGFVMPPQGSPRFLTASAADPAKALTTMRVPDPNAAAAAAAQLAASTQAAAGAGVTATIDPATTTTTTDPAATAPVAATTPTPSATTAPVTSTTAPVTSTATPATTAAAGGASAPQG